MVCTRIYMCNRDELRIYVVSGVVDVNCDRVSMGGSLLYGGVVCV